MNKFLLLFIASLLWISCEDNTTTTDADNPTPPITKAAPVANTAKAPAGKPTLISGDITGLNQNQKLFFDRKTLDATDVVGSVVANPNGAFELSTPINRPGIYRLRIGARPLYMLLEGGEKVHLTAKVENGKIVEHQIKGSLYAETMKEWQGKIDPAAAKEYLKLSLIHI